MQYECYVSYYKIPFLANGEDKFLFNFNDSFWKWEKVNHSFNWDSEIKGNINLENDGRTPTYLVLRNTTTNKDRVYVFTNQNKLTNNVINWEIVLDIFSTHSKTIFDNNVLLDLTQYHYDYRVDKYTLRNYDIGLEPFYNVNLAKLSPLDKTNNNINNILKTMNNKYDGSKNVWNFSSDKHFTLRFMKDAPLPKLNIYGESNYRNTGNVYYVFKGVKYGVILIPLLSEKEDWYDIEYPLSGSTTYAMLAQDGGLNLYISHITNSTQTLDWLADSNAHEFVGIYNGFNYWDYIKNNGVDSVIFQRRMSGTTYDAIALAIHIPFKGKEINWGASDYIVKPFQENDSYAYNKLTYHWYYNILNIFNPQGKIVSNDTKLFLNFTNGIKLYEPTNTASNGGLLLDYGLGIDRVETEYLQQLKENKRAWTMGLFSLATPSFHKTSGRYLPVSKGFNRKFTLEGTIAEQNHYASYEYVGGAYNFNPLTTIKGAIGNTVKLAMNNQSAYWNASKARDIDSSLIDMLTYNFLYSENQNTNTQISLYTYQRANEIEFKKVIRYLNLYGMEKEGLLNLKDYLNKMKYFGYVRCEGTIIGNEIYDKVDDTINIKEQLIGMFVKGIRIWKFIPNQNINLYVNNFA